MPRRNYALPGCLLVLVLLVAIVGGATYVRDMLNESGPDVERIRVVGEYHVRAREEAQGAATVEVTAIHPRRDRFSIIVRRWAIQGTIARSGSGSNVSDFLAVLRLTCDDHADDGCWTLDRLTLSDPSLD